jgi:zinc transporter ZupT
LALKFILTHICLHTLNSGIFLMLAFTHLIPHSLHTLEAANINPMYAFQATVVGYLIIFAIEKLFFDTPSILNEVQDENTPIRRPSIVSDSRESQLDSHSSNLSAKSEDTSPSRSRSGSVVSQQSAVVLLLAMAVHSLFETVALGMAPDRTSAIIMATSVALHQPAESLALLVAFLKTSMERGAIVRCVHIVFVYFNIYKSYSLRVWMPVQVAWIIFDHWPFWSFLGAIYPSTCLSYGRRTTCCHDCGNFSLRRDY